MADVDFVQFGHDFSRRLGELGYSLDRAVAKWPLTNKALLSRATHGETLSPGNYLLLCEMAGLDPYKCFTPAKRPRPPKRATMKTVLAQAVTRVVPRETGGDLDR